MGDGYIQSSAQVRQLAMKTNVWVEAEWLVLLITAARPPCLCPNTY